MYAIDGFFGYKRGKKAEKKAKGHGGFHGKNLPNCMIIGYLFLLEYHGDLFMKKWFLVIAAAFSCSLLYANYAESVATLTTKVILQNTNGYFVLSDRSCWKAIGFSKRWRSLNEWWNSVELVPSNYECVPNDWYVGSEIEVYSKYRNLNVYEKNAANYEELKQCTHLLVNGRTGQILFAIALEPEECMNQVFKDAYGEGYKKGVSEGAAKSYKNTTDSYNDGYNEGHKDGYYVGYQEGYKSAINNEPR